MALKKSDDKILEIQGHPVRISRKKIKSLRMRLIPPHGEIRVSVPPWYSDKKVTDFILSRWDWVMKHRKTIADVHPLHRQSYEQGASILYKGELLVLKEASLRSPRLEDGGLLIPAAADEEKRKRAVENWYRRELKREAEVLAEKWCPVMNLEYPEIRLKKMTSRWGSCNIAAARIWLNLELITMRPELLEFVFVHELVHLHEPSHNKRFKYLMDRYYPAWRDADRMLKGRV